jgi:hypothetical protein
MLSNSILLEFILGNTDDTDQTDLHGSVRIRVIRTIRVLY